ncbi:hypothetical protein PTKIN_Ptkin04bG0016500 [Pterospermum kingtungense]
MAFRSAGYLKQQLTNQLRGKATYATSTPPKMKPYVPTADFGPAQDAKQLPKKMKGNFVPVCVALGMIAFSTSLGLYTALHELKDSPQVRVNKKRREMLPEVEEPDRVLSEADKFLSHSIFRKIAHVQDKGDDDHDDFGDHIHAHKPTPKAETLESVGVSPKFRVLDG